MKQKIAHIALVVKDYDEAIRYYTEKLGFVLIEDNVLSDTKRWVLIAPNVDTDFTLLLARASGEEQQSRIGNQTGGRVFLFLHTDNFQKYFENLLQHNVKIVRQPAEEAWGKVAVFEDLYGNLWDLIESVANK